MARAWSRLSMVERESVMSAVHSSGAVVLVSAGGSTEAPFSTVTGANYGIAAYEHSY